MDEIKLPAVQKSLLADIAREVSRVEEEIISNLPALPDNATDADEALRRAEVAHLALIELGHKEKITAAARRYQLWMSYKYELWRNVRIPLTNPDGSPTGDYHFFDSFDSYFTYIADEWGVRSPSSLSILRNGAVVLLPAADAGLIVSSDGHKYGVEDVLELDEGNQQLLIGVANRALNPQQGREATDIATIGRAADIVMSSNTHDEAVLGLKQAGLVGSKPGDFDKMLFYTYDTGSEVYIAGKLSPLQYRALLLVLRAKADTLSSTLDEMSKLFYKDENDESEDSGATFSAYVTRLAGNSNGS